MWVNICNQPFVPILNLYNLLYFISMPSMSSYVSLANLLYSPICSLQLLFPPLGSSTPSNFI
uniref:Uncharacterized protein n=1 Tax=Arundo donax TaxID=35708 RepID=A0A0A9HCW7_ARUDO